MSSIAAFPRVSKKRSRKPPKVSDVVLRDFSGGLRVTDNEIALKSKYATKLVNMWADTDTSQVLRFGTDKFADLSADIVDLTYFNGNLICVLVNGEVEAVDDDANVTSIWNTTIAAALPGAPAAWSSGLTEADFTEFRGELIVVNGTDKPILFDKTLSVTYLQDLGSGSNVNTPIARFVTTVSNYVVMAGIPGNETKIVISAVGTSGTYPGDPAPNDAVLFDVGSYTGKSSTAIRGIGTFKKFLVVFFDNFSVIFSLGVYNGSGVHTPDEIDTYENLGTANHKLHITTEEDILFASNNGIVSAEKNIFGGTLQVKGVSEDLGKSYPQTYGNVAAGEADCFAVNDTLSKVAFFMFKKEDGTRQAFGMRYRDNFDKRTWAMIEGWSFTCGCTSSKGRVFFGEGSVIYQYGNNVFANEEFYADYSDIATAVEGNAIDFDWEFPWLDGGNRNKTKKLVRVAFDTTGTSAFTLQCFVNNFYKDTDGNYIPNVTMDFVAGDAGGYGNNEGGYGDNGYGGGRRANDERFYGFPIKFRIMKMRITGSTRSALRIVSITLIYQKGNYAP